MTAEEPLHVPHARAVLLPIPGQPQPPVLLTGGLQAELGQPYQAHRHPLRWLVRSIGFLVPARHSSHPSRCFRSRKASSCRNRAANNSTICNPVNSTAEVTSVNRSVCPSTWATTALTGTSGPATHHRQTTSFQRTFRWRP